MLYADDQDAQFVTGPDAPFGVDQTKVANFAQDQEPAFADNGSRTIPTGDDAFMLGSIFDVFKGSALKKYQSKGDSNQSIFDGYSPDIDAYAYRVTQIPAKAPEKAALDAQVRDVVNKRSSIAAAFAPGATPGSDDISRLNEMVIMTKALGKSVSAAEAKYGIRPTAPPAGFKASAGILGLPHLPWWAWVGIGLGGLALAFPKKIKAVLGGRRR